MEHVVQAHRRAEQVDFSPDPGDPRAASPYPTCPVVGARDRTPARVRDERVLRRAFLSGHFPGAPEKASNVLAFLCFGLVCTSLMDLEKERAEAPISASRTDKQLR